MYLLNKIFTHKCTVVIFMCLVVYTYNNIIFGGIALIIFLGFFLVYLGLVFRYSYVLVDHPYLKVKDNRIVFKKWRGFSLKVVIFGSNGLPLPNNEIPLTVEQQTAEQLLENAKRTGEMLVYKTIGSRILICVGSVLILGGACLLPVGLDFIKEIGFVPENSNGTQVLEFHRYHVEHRNGLPYKSMNNHLLNYAPDNLKVKLLKQPFLFDWRAHFCPCSLVPPLHSLAGFTPGCLSDSVPVLENNLLNNELLNKLINGEQLQTRIAHKVIDELLDLECEW
jgi:hypothetical protein